MSAGATVRIRNVAPAAGCNLHILTGILKTFFKKVVRLFSPLQVTSKMSTITSKNERKRDRNAIIEEYQQEQEENEYLKMVLSGIIDTVYANLRNHIFLLKIVISNIVNNMSKIPDSLVFNIIRHFDV
jgi:hypothetical protein